MYKKSLRNFAKALTAAMSLSCIVMPLTACGGDKKLSNSSTPLVLATDVLDGVFNPFFYTSGPDGEVISQTQIGMLSSNKNGQMVAGWDEPCVSLDFSYVTTDNRPAGQENNKDYEKYYTDYYFAIKDNIKYSDGEALSIKDVLFNMYFYLDPAYTGSSTMYSVAIKGLSNYRNQTESEEEGSASANYFESVTEARISKIEEWALNETENDWEDLPFYNYYDEEHEKLEDYTIVKDILEVHTLFQDEVRQDWNNSKTVDIAKAYEKYKDINGRPLVTKQWQDFLISYGELTFSLERGGVGQPESYYKLNDNYLGKTNSDGNCDPSLYKDSEVSEETLRKHIYDKMFDGYEKANETYKNNLLSVISYYATAATFREYVKANVIEREVSSDSGLAVKSITGITTEKMDYIPYMDGSELKNRDLKNKDGVKQKYDVLKIRIDGVDPKAIQNFSFTVAPGHYYGSEWNKVNITGDNPYFGVKFANTKYMRDVKENHVPVGAGPYRVATESGGKATLKKQFFKDNIVYLARNDSFLLGKPKIKLLRFKVINSNMLYNAVKNGEVHYASPSMDLETLNLMNTADKNTMRSEKADNLGYGYIGISAKYINNQYIRQVIMQTLDPDMCVKYYGDENASVIRRPMSKTLVDYYPDSARPYYTYIGDREENLISEGVRKDRHDWDYSWLTGILTDENKGKCTINSNGMLSDENGKPLKYTFTVAGDSDDHPAAAMLKNSAEILNNIGFDITVSHDSQALSKLSNGSLTVWAAAWSSSSDPDMYQVYHKDSSATSTLAWGYTYLKSAKASKEERDLLDHLAEQIELGREGMDAEYRRPYYWAALDDVMELAVEFPTYQRKVYYVWKKGTFDESTMYTGTAVTTYQSPLSEIWNISFNEK